jgi:streptomycin 3"-kinase
MTELTEGSGDLDPSVSDAWNEIHGGESRARVFVRVDGLQYAKLVTRDRTAELRAERDRCTWAQAHGVPGPAVLSWHANESGARLVTSAVPGVPAHHIDAERARMVWPRIIVAVRELHGMDVADCPFDRGTGQMLTLARDVVARDAVETAFLRPEQRTSTPRALLDDLEQQLPLRRLQEKNDRVVCHGDLCLPNIMVDPVSLDVTGFVDLGRLGTADRHADLSLLLTNAGDTWPDHAHALTEMLLARYGRPVDGDRLEFHLCLDPLTWG